MNEKDQKMFNDVFCNVARFEMSNYQTLFLTQLTIRRKEVETSGEEETLEESVSKVMKIMQKSCGKSPLLCHKRNIVETSVSKCLQELEAELSDAKSIRREWNRGSIVENVLEYLVRI